MPLSPPKAYIRIIQNFQFLQSSFPHYLCRCLQLLLIHEQRPSLSAFLTNRPAAGAGAGEPAGSLPVAMPAGASWIFFMPTSPAKNVCIVVAWPGMDWTKLVEQQGWCHRHTSSSRTAVSWYLGIRVWCLLLLVASYWLLHHVRAGILCACIPDKRRLCGHWVRQFCMQCNIVLHGFVIIRQELCLFSNPYMLQRSQFSGRWINTSTTGMFVMVLWRQACALHNVMAWNSSLMCGLCTQSLANQSTSLYVFICYVFWAFGKGISTASHAK
ncbi:hypothetical protein BDA96_02G413200 [Sorghum bicolor]|jgi:hypothetical protein|uniref:Uncharacterized protein n=2 Tax=Sorghum bicolor TaxID=4558 RepID=A0A921RUP4_SORBI|nr:hypothetical protein BDA96_02G413200 [Sorghum bicolor]OQU90345.1 hypothetical protein SORBI_3002G393266 [Sorghum bicolor]